MQNYQTGTKLILTKGAWRGIIVMFMADDPEGYIVRREDQDGLFLIKKDHVVAYDGVCRLLYD